MNGVLGSTENTAYALHIICKLISIKIHWIVTESNLHCGCSQFRHSFTTGSPNSKSSSFTKYIGTNGAWWHFSPTFVLIFFIKIICFQWYTSRLLIRIQISQQIPLWYKPRAFTYIAQKWCHIITYAPIIFKVLNVDFQSNQIKKRQVSLLSGFLTHSWKSETLLQKSTIRLLLWRFL